MFTGDSDNPATSTGRCRTVACPALLPGRTERFCQACQAKCTGSSLGEDEFAVTFVPPPARSAPGAARASCRVSRDGHDCAWPQYCRGLCLSHYSMWGAYRRRHARGGNAAAVLDLPAWLRTVAVPHTDPPGCLVAGCPAKAMTKRGLCNYHLPLWWRSGCPGPPRDWAAHQIPFLAGNQFSLAVLPELVRYEVLLGLQHADTPGRSLDPVWVRAAVTVLAGLRPRTLLDVPGREVLNQHKRHVRHRLEYLYWAAQVGFEEFLGVKQTEKSVFDLRLVGLAPDEITGRHRRNPGTADLSSIAQLWLRRLVQRWVEVEHPSARRFQQTLRAVRIASGALAQRPGGGHDPAALRFPDMGAVITAIWSQTKADGAPYASGSGANWQALWFKLLDYGGRAGWLDAMASSFLRDRNAHPTKRHAERNEDELGKAVPESVISQLDAQLDRLGLGPVYGVAAIPPDDLCAMYQTVYVLLRDTGRRPTEIAALTRDCLEQANGEVSLIWDNRKGKRMRRRLPITAETAQTVRAWQARRNRLAVPSRGDRYLFPTLTRDSRNAHLGSPLIATAIRIWVGGLPELLDEARDAAGNRVAFDRSRIYPYAFRHSYAQRHADAGTPIDVLRELMDHKSIATTAGYYTVSIKRRRAAVSTLSAHVMDRRGAPASCSTTAYEMRSVAVPFGGCTEPSNIQAGGRACPIRFQCAGCGFYRPDPSYLTAIEQHINDLRSDRETALALDAAEYVTAAMPEEINAYDAVAATMRTRLAELPAEERAEIEQASTVLRKIRAGSGAGTAMLPLTVIQSETGNTR